MRAMLVGLLVTAVVVAGAAWWFTRPAAAVVSVTPNDSIITFEGIDYIGDMSVEDLEPGVYEVSVGRTGFEPVATTLDLRRGKTLEREFTLDPLPQALTIESTPDGADCRIEASDGTVLVGTTPFQGTIPAGLTRVSLANAECNDWSQEIFVDRETTLKPWLDPKGQLVHCLGVWDCGPAPKAAAFSPDGATVWLALLAGPPSIQVLDTKTGAITGEVTLGTHGAVEIAFSEDGSRAFASQMETALVFEIDTATYEVLRTFDTGSAWSKVVEVSADGKRIFVSNWSGHDVSEIDLESGSLVRRLPSANTPRGLYASRDGRSLYVAGFGSGTIERVDLATGERKTLYSGGTALRHLVADEDGGFLYASDMGTDKVIKVSLQTGESSTLATTDAKPNTIALSPDGKVLFVSCRGENNPRSYYLPGPEWGTVLLIDTASGELLDAVVGGNQPTGLDVSSDGKTLVFTDFLDDRIRLFEIPAHGELAAGNGGLCERRFDLKRK